MCKYKAYVKMYVSKEIEFNSTDIFWAKKRAAREMRKLIKDGVGDCKVQHAELTGICNKDIGFNILYAENRLTMNKILKDSKKATCKKKKRSA